MSLCEKRWTTTDTWSECRQLVPDVVTLNSVLANCWHAETIPYCASLSQIAGPRRPCSWAFRGTRTSGFGRTRRASCNCSRLSLPGTNRQSEFLAVILPRPAESAALYASADITGTLQPDECYIIKGNKAYIGPVAVWRYPSHGPADIGILQAKQPPAGMALPRVSFAGNAMVLSKWGDVSKKWADGDLDGDLNFASSPVCFLAALVRLIQDTAPYVDAQDYEA
ncbi:unnamed protein product [Symbiodinium sp. CCMP2592]|nr:unnamed protein product [Symbiodinium sp. CCMP2592]